jgi:hypothetical protein
MFGRNGVMRTDGIKNHLAYGVLDIFLSIDLELVLLQVS